MNKKVSLVLSGGGARGLAHIGVIEELEKQGLNIVSIAGVSMGAVVGGAYAAGQLNEFKEWMQSLDRKDVIKLVDFKLGPQGVVEGSRVFNRMKEFLPDVNIEDLPIKYVAMATDLINNKEAVFEDGSLYDAMRASVSIPSVLTPVNTEGKLLVDGGVINNIPSKYIKRVDGDLLVVSDVSAEIPARRCSTIENENVTKISEYFEKIKSRFSRKESGFFDLLYKTLSIVRSQLALMTFELYPPDILINMSKDEFGFFEFHRTKDLVEVGREVTAESLDKSTVL